MRRVKHREENSPSTRRGPGGRTSPGDVIEVEDELAEQLLAKPYFEPAPEAVDEGDGTDGDEEESEPDEAFDEDAWLDQEYETRAHIVRTGEVDAHLETIDDIETSGNVRDAIGERRAELEE